MKPKGQKVPGNDARKGIDAYRSQFEAMPFYRESISYTIDELRDFLNEAEQELIKLKINDPENRCISMLPYLSQKDGRLSVLLTPSAYKAGSTHGTSPFKHRFNIDQKRPFGNEGLKGDAGADPDPDNPYGGLATPTDPYNIGQGTP